MAGYCDRPLAQKLGIKPATRVVALRAPPAYASLLGSLPEGATLHTRLAAASGFIHRFARQRDDLAADFPTEDVVRELGLREGLVDVKVCAIDDVWSGLKFVRRIENRCS